jgi:uncharacterized membrane protein YphA (DoxX/SURF4 family)
MFEILAFACALYAITQLLPAGIAKLDTKKPDETFVTLGGDPMRYAVGIAEIAGPILLLMPMTAPFGLLLIAPVMLGAIYIHVRVWNNSPKNAVIALVTAVASVVFWAL